MASSSEYEVAVGEYRFDPLEPPVALRESLRPDEVADVQRSPDRRGAFLVQFVRPLTDEDRRRVHAEFGLRLVKYFPKLAYLEWITPRTATRLTADELVRACVPYAPAFKVAPTVRRVPYRREDREVLESILLEAFLFDDADASDVVNRLSEVASDVVVFDDRSLGGTLRLRFRLSDMDDLEQITRIEEVQWIEEVAEIVEDDAGAAGTIQSGSSARQSIWDRGLHGEGQIIGIVDTSPVDINHCFFRDAADNDPGPNHRKVQSIRNISETDSTFHATFASGCAAGDDVGNPGGAAGRGSAWAARIVSGNTRDLVFGGASMLFELNAAASAGARIHSNSWHDDTDGAGNPAVYNATASAVDVFTWNNEDNVVLGSAGNSGEEQGPPGTAKNAICVASALADPNEMNFGDGNPGPTAEGRRKPDLAAVGCSIRSARVGTPCATRRRGCATSWATPHAAGAAALVRQYFTEGWHPHGRRVPTAARVPSGALLKAMLLNSAREMTGVSGYPNDSVGWGLICLDDVLSFQGSARLLAVWDRRNSDGLSTAETHVHHLDVASAATPLKVTLVWSEPAGSSGADPVVNDLDLRVTSPDASKSYLGNNFDNGTSIPGGAPDSRNNVEIVVIPVPEAGKWTIVIDAREVNVGNPHQGYAVVATIARPQWLIPALHVAMG